MCCFYPVLPFLQVTSIVARSPQVLGYGVASMESKVAFLMQVMAYSAAYCRLHDGNTFVTGDICVSSPTLPNLCTHGLIDVLVFASPETQALHASREDAGTIVFKYPQVLNLSVEKNLRLKIDFFTKELQGLPEDVRDVVVGSPTILGYSLTKRLRPRLEVMRSTGVEPKFAAHIWFVSSYTGVQFNKWIEGCLVDKIGANGRGDMEIRRRMKVCRAMLHET